MREPADTIRDESRDESRDDMDDLELLTRMLNGQLDAARVAIVRKRLEDDPAFRDFAAPLLLTWNVPPHRDRFPRPEGDWERAWERLQQRIRVDIPAAPPAPAPTRKRWSIGRIFEISFWSVMIYVIVLAFGAVLWFELIKPNYFPDPTDGSVAPSTSPGPVVVTAEPETMGPIRRVPYDTAWVPIDASGLPGSGIRPVQATLVIVRGEVPVRLRSNP